MQTEHFYPKPKLIFDPTNSFKVKYEGMKAAHEADLSAVEKCLGKCSIKYSENGLNDTESRCLK